MSYVHVTTNAQAERARLMAADKRAAQRDIDKAAAKRRGDVIQSRKLDGLDLVHQSGDLTDDMLRVGKAYQQAWTTIQGGRGRNALDMTPPGDKEAALQIVVDAGKLVDRIEAHCTTAGELGVLRAVCGFGISVRQFAGGGKAYRRANELLVGLLGRIADARPLAW